MIKSFNSLFVTMFGLGKIKYMPGTFGSLATVIVLYYLFHELNVSPNIILIGLIIIFIYSFYAVSSHIENNENKDPGEIIIDEFLGQSIPIYLYEISHGTTKEGSEAIELDKSPPVQDSANETLSFFLINFLTTLLAKFFIIKCNF